MTPKAFHALFARIGTWAKMPFAVHPHMLRHGRGYALANAGHDTRSLQAWLGHKNIQHTVPTRSWRRIGSRTSGDKQRGAANNVRGCCALFDLVGAAEQRERDGESECCGRS
jgi:integrase